MKLNKLLFALISFLSINSNRSLSIDETIYNSLDFNELQQILQKDTAKINQLISFVKREEQRHFPGWSKSYHILPDFINKHGLKSGCEIGVAFGTHSQAILEKTNIEMLYSVDPYKHFSMSDYNDPMNFDQSYFDLLYYLVQKRLSPFNVRSKLLRKTSVEASQEIQDRSLDFVYIDGNHSYEGAKTDLIAWYDKVRPGGLVSGDDYGHGNFPGVKKAVDQFFAQHGLTVHQHKDVPEFFWAFKPHMVSFIIPCYNCASTVAESIESIYKQNLKCEFEVICTDDGSTDKTLSILLSYQKKYPNLHVFIHEKNKGGAPTRNTCVSHSQGDLIFCLDSDNVLVPDSVNKLIELLDQTGCEAAAFEELRFFKGSFKRINSWTIKAQNNICDLNHFFQTNINPASSGNYLYTKKSYVRAQGYPEYAQALDAWGFGFRQLTSGTKIAILPNSFYWHRTEGNSYYQRCKNLNPIAYQIVLERKEIFTQKSLTLLKNYQKQNVHFFLEIDKHSFTLV